jgi:hypothetical protein
MRTEALWATFGRQVVVWVNRHLGDALYAILAKSLSFS